MVISKETFIKIIDFIQRKNEQQLALAAALENICPSNYVDAFIFDEYNNFIVDVLQELFEDVDDDIGYFIWEQQAPKDKDGNPLFTDADSLYDYLIQRMEERKKETPEIDFDEPGLGAVGLLDD
jgi:hypothetical protein